MHIKMDYSRHGLTINVPGKVDVFTIRDVLPCDDEGGFGTFPLNGGWEGAQRAFINQKRTPLSSRFGAPTGTMAPVLAPAPRWY